MSSFLLVISLSLVLLLWQEPLAGLLFFSDEGRGNRTKPVLNISSPVICFLSLLIWRLCLCLFLSIKTMHFFFKHRICMVWIFMGNSFQKAFLLFVPTEKKRGDEIEKKANCQWLLLYFLSIFPHPILFCLYFSDIK